MNCHRKSKTNAKMDFISPYVFKNFSAIISRSSDGGSGFHQCRHLYSGVMKRERRKATQWLEEAFQWMVADDGSLDSYFCCYCWSGG